MVIKARRLLPDADNEDEQEYPRRVLVGKILVNEMVRRSGDELARLNTLHCTMTGRSTRDTVLSLDEVSLHDIAQAYLDVLSRLEARSPDHFTPPPRPSVRESMLRVIDGLPRNGRPVSIVRLLDGVQNRMEVVTYLVGILELVRLGAVGVIQEQLRGDLFLRRKKRSIDLDILQEEYA